MIAAGLLCLIAVDFLQLIIPRIMKHAIDDLTLFQASTKKLAIYALYIIGIAVMMSIFRYLWRKYLIGTSRVVEEGLRNRLFAHIQSLSSPYFDKTKTGDIMAHATNDIMHIRMAIGMGMVALTDAVILGSAAIGFMLYINRTLTLFALIPMPFIVFGARFFSRKMHRLYGAVQESFSELTESVREQFAGIQVIKAYTREKEESLLVEAKSKDYIKKNIRLVKITGFFFPMMLLFSNISLVIVLYLGGRQTIYSTITPGDFVAFINYLALITWPMMAMGWVTNLVQRGKASLDRINKIMDTPPEIFDKIDAKTIKDNPGEIVFENVSFSFGGDGAQSVLSDINIRIEKGTITGIAGPPGSGKTTLLGMIPRLYDVSGGRILIDGEDIRTIRLFDIRKTISYMPQEPFLFDGTIRDNITLGGKGIKEADLEELMEKASLLETVKNFPAGIDTMVGEKGVILSGGQKQRIALARSLLSNSPVLILDDPVSQVDVETGSAIINNIKSMMGEKTIIIVSHRLSALCFADQIIVMDTGKIIESGDHDLLMKLGEYYAKTFRMQEIEEEMNAL
ncbi:MAG: ABC transporter ATP-binding protein [Desulfobacterium sp.]|nr:ABC transporter ATP-binding protein [Desulfobacterium sp.]MBU3949833.1 ABC transporter ATP-binding protein/permease [Pseudomonadota bacterium]MBU4035981.1 ABC transporter ATP-binding protein/permease [Pseudomonadota bacterium]